MESNVPRLHALIQNAQGPTSAKCLGGGKLHRIGHGGVPRFQAPSPL